jgi:hypothetical protein
MHIRIRTTRKYKKNNIEKSTNRKNIEFKRLEEANSEMVQEYLKK